jgi:hypothetical protein
MDHGVGMAKVDFSLKSRNCLLSANEVPEGISHPRFSTASFFLQSRSVPAQMVTQGNLEIVNTP